MLPELEFLRNDIGEHLQMIEMLLPREYTLTLLCRHNKNSEAHIFLSKDKTSEVVIKAIKDLDVSVAQQNIKEAEKTSTDKRNVKYLCDYCDFTDTCKLYKNGHRYTEHEECVKYFTQ